MKQNIKCLFVNHTVSQSALSLHQYRKALAYHRGEFERKFVRLTALWNKLFSVPFEIIDDCDCTVHQHKIIWIIILWIFNREKRIALTLQTFYVSHKYVDIFLRIVRDFRKTQWEGIDDFNKTINLQVLSYISELGKCGFSW